MKITLISDTHTKHHFCEKDLPGGDLLIHAGDFMNSGYHEREAFEFFDWFNNLSNYNTKVFIAGNHDRWMQDKPKEAQNILSGYKNIDYLQDEQLTLYFDGPNGDHPEDNVRIYGSPWQPEFYNWAFNLPRNGDKLKAKWDAIPTDTDILITHGPAQGHLDTSGPPHNTPNLGCELLRNHIDTVARPKIHVCGHIHGGHGYKFDGQTHYFNASILNEQYYYFNDPITMEWDQITNAIELIV
jgi:Icc-related predicted phosphoesterase